MIASALLLVVSLAGCGRDGSMPATPATAEEPAPPLTEREKYDRDALVSEGELFRIHHLEGEFSAEQVARLRSRLREGRAHIEERLHASGPPLVDVYLYRSAADKERVTGVKRIGHADSDEAAFHLVLSSKSERFTAPHEDAHVVAYHAWGKPRNPVMQEGVAVWVASTLGDERDKRGAAARLLRTHKLPPLAALVDDFKGQPQTAAYTAAGAFTWWVAETKGIGTVERLFLARRLRPAIETELEASLDVVEARWHAWLRADD